MFVNQKVQEIGYALIRVAAYIRRQEIKQRIERLALEFLESVSKKDFETALKTTASLESLIKLAVSIYEIESGNAQVIMGELESINAAMRQFAALEELPHLPDLFSQKIAESNTPDEDSGSALGMSTTLRQSAVLEKIRQSENRQTQLKDLLAAFPDVSERTMRYDLQKLCIQGLLERVGNGGPGSHYTLKA